MTAIFCRIIRDFAHISTDMPKIDLFVRDLSCEKSLKMGFDFRGGDLDIEHVAIDDFPGWLPKQRPDPF